MKILSVTTSSAALMVLPVGCMAGGDGGDDGAQEAMTMFERADAATEMTDVADLLVRISRCYWDLATSWNPA